MGGLPLNQVGATDGAIMGLSGRNRDTSIMANDSIVIKGASEHNLKHIDLTLPRNALIVITGVSELYEPVRSLSHIINAHSL